jgi:hypothetical protein
MVLTTLCKILHELLIPQQLGITLTGLTAKLKQRPIRLGNINNNPLLGNSNVYHQGGDSLSKTSGNNNEVQLSTGDIYP